MAETPFDSIESAQYYLRLLAAEVEAVRSEVQRDAAEAARDAAVRRLDAHYIVDYRLKQRAQPLDSSHRILNDVDAAASRATGPLLHL